MYNITKIRAMSYAAMVSAFLVPKALAQVEATVSLTHDDADGIIGIGDTVTWTLAVGYTGDATHVATINMAILGDNSLGTSSNFAYSTFGDGQGFNGGTNGGTSNGAGIQFVNFNNVDLPVFDPAPIRLDNPLTAGSFEFTASNIGTLEYELTRGLASSAFVVVSLSPFAEALFIDPEDVTLVIDPLTIVPSPTTMSAMGLAGLIATRRRRA
ncbi:MAG: hypothetical protein ACF8Q5_00795 [Phycisphaerales bacterium JB040]